MALVPREIGVETEERHIGPCPRLVVVGEA